MRVEEIPQELVDMLDHDAGRQHNRQGSVLASLARILTRYDEMRADGVCGVPFPPSPTERMP